jgi:Thioredoxin/Protein of unknown function with PCYCGC motif
MTLAPNDSRPEAGSAFPRRAFLISALSFGSLGVLAAVTLPGLQTLIHDAHRPLPAWASETPHTARAYHVALRRPDLLAQLNCYCGCMESPNLQHLNLHDCYLYADGTLNPHAAGCGICQAEALDADHWAMSGAAAPLLLLTGCGTDATCASAPLEPGRDNVRGAANAPLVIEEWADYQRPVCGSFARLQPQLDQSVLADGKARLVFRNMAFLGQESVWAAEAAECAGDQGRYWDSHDVLFASQGGENIGAFRIERLKQFAVQTAH